MKLKMAVLETTGFRDDKVGGGQGAEGRDYSFVLNRRRKGGRGWYTREEKVN